MTYVKVHEKLSFKTHHKLATTHLIEVILSDPKEMEDAWYHLHLKCKERKENIWITLWYPAFFIYIHSISWLRIGKVLKLIIHESNLASFENLQLRSSVLLLYAIYRTKSFEGSFNVHVYNGTMYWTYFVLRNGWIVRIVIQNRFNSWNQRTLEIYDWSAFI